MSETVLVRNPHPAKRGVHIDAGRYRTVRGAVEATLREGGVVSFQNLVRDVERRIGATFDGSVPWYVTTVKLDLEARGVVERVPDQKPQHLRLAEGRGGRVDRVRRNSHPSAPPPFRHA